MPQPNRQRLSELSIMNILLCLLVIFIHTSGDAVVSYPIGTPSHLAVFIPWWIAGMAVYGFIFLSGLKLCLHSGKEFHLGRFYLGRVKTILLPYVLWVLIYFFIFNLANGTPLSLMTLIKGLLTGNITSHLYFIVVILQFYLLAPLWRWCVKKIHPLIALPIALLLMQLFRLHLPALLPFEFPYFDRLFPSYLLFWLGGCYAGAYYEKFKSWIAAHPWLCTGAFILGTTADLFVGITNTIGNRYLPIHEESHLLFLAVAIPFSYLLGIKGSALYRKKGIALLDRSSFAIYLSHLLIMELIANKAILRFGIQSTALALGLRTLLTVGIALSLCMGYTTLKKHLAKKRG